ncbi:monovalent cation/H+ antiporter subunit C [Alcanivorax hongdengensis A-11-3]|uniref:Monovalent cation/H+ antiporter subunit C n=1 Tax=Alcanivorax hongdengensis A-11-3 TaxID=1177179 RepID=L0W7V8_9GAMM|nr:Na+/H+ antiporter subunit C [Alcanivorax hongdengensis]EKF72986.1 monovalent cation/H+ antiporter subunit C [Alcanivorax hongdengensis A-11-3]
MELLVAVIIGVLVSTGVYLCLRARTFPVVMGLTLLSYGVNVFLFAMGGLKIDKVAVVGLNSDPTDPLPQALVLTAIVIGFAMTAFLVVLALRSQAEHDTDHVDGNDSGEGGR